MFQIVQNVQIADIFTDIFLREANFAVLYILTTNFARFAPANYPTYFFLFIFSQRMKLNWSLSSNESPVPKGVK